MEMKPVSGQSTGAKAVDTPKYTVKKMETKDGEVKEKRDTSIEVEVDAKELAIDQAKANEKMQRIIENIKEQLPNSEPRFGVHEPTNRVVIKIVDKDSQKLIREFPLEKTLDSVAKIQEMAGIMVDTKL